MHVKRIHEMLEKLTKCAEMEFEKGLENVDTAEMGAVVDIMKDLAEAEYYAKISKAMDESEYGEDYDFGGAYEDDMRKGYRGQPRDSRGRYMSRRGRRRGYEEPMMYEDYDWTDMERMRDIDRPMGKMYYGGDNGMGGQYSSRTQRDSREGRSGGARRGYMESKEMNKDKGEKMKELENYMKELSTDVTEMIGDASPEEKNMLKSKMQTLLQKIQ